MSGIIHIALVAVTDTTTTNEDTSVAIDVLANDSDLDGYTLSISSVDQAVYGTTIIANGKLTYTRMLTTTEVTASPTPSVTAIMLLLAQP